MPKNPGQQGRPGGDKDRPKDNPGRKSTGPDKLTGGNAAPKTGK
jgi:hypothetical protein